MVAILSTIGKPNTIGKQNRPPPSNSEHVQYYSPRCMCLHKTNSYLMIFELSATWLLYHLVLILGQPCAQQKNHFHSLILQAVVFCKPFKKRGSLKGTFNWIVGLTLMVFNLSMLIHQKTYLSIQPIINYSTRLKNGPNKVAQTHRLISASWRSSLVCSIYFFGLTIFMEVKQLLQCHEVML